LISSTPQIRTLLSNPARFKALVTGRRWGKTNAGFIWLCHDEMQPGELRWHISPFRVQAKRNVWPLLVWMSRQIQGAQLSVSELKMTLPNGSAIQLHGADNPDGLPGVGLSRVWLDEFALWRKQEMWQLVVRPMLTQSKGPALFTSSPRGYDRMYDFFRLGQDPDEGDWASWIYKTKDSPFVDSAEVDAARRDMDPILYAQEYEASFETGGNRAAWNFDRARHVLKTETMPSGPQSWIGLDFNVEPMVAVIGGELAADRVHYYDELVIPTNAHTAMMARMLREKYPQVTRIFPDPSGASRSVRGPKSDYQILTDHGFRVEGRKAAPEQVDRLNSWNRMLQDADGNVHMTIDPKCKHLIDDCERTKRTVDGRIDKQARDPHALDAASYAIEYMYPIHRRQVVRHSRFGG